MTYPLYIVEMAAMYTQRTLLLVSNGNYGALRQSFHFGPCLLYNSLHYSCCLYLLCHTTPANETRRRILEPRRLLVVALPEDNLIT
jgi:hypothetical protein